MNDWYMQPSHETYIDLSAKNTAYAVLPLDGLPTGARLIDHNYMTLHIVLAGEPVALCQMRPNGEPMDECTEDDHLCLKCQKQARKLARLNEPAERKEIPTMARHTEHDETELNDGTTIHISIETHGDEQVLYADTTWHTFSLTAADGVVSFESRWNDKTGLGIGGELDAAALARLKELVSAGVLDEMIRLSAGAVTA